MIETVEDMVDVFSKSTAKLQERIAELEQENERLLKENERLLKALEEQDNE